MTQPEPLDPRVAELLSALLDGAVTPEERALAEAWLERSEAARAEYRSLHQVKSVLGGLGPVEPPFGLYDRMLRQGTPVPTVTSAVDRASGAAGARRRSALGAAVASVAASAAAFVFVGGAAAPERTVTPSIDEVASGDAGGFASVRGAAGTIRTLRQEADAVDWDGLPRGERLDRGGDEIWRDLTTDDGEERVVVHRGGVVVTVTGEGVDVDELIDVGRAVVRDQPASDEGVGGRLRDACENLLRSLALG